MLPKYNAPPTLLNRKTGLFYTPKYNAPPKLSEFSVKKVLVEKGFRCTLRSDDVVKGAKERLPRKEEQREGKLKEEEERGKRVFN